LQDQQGGRFRQRLVLAAQLLLQVLDLLVILLALFPLGLGLGGTVRIGLQAGIAPGSYLLDISPFWRQYSASSTSFNEAASKKIANLSSVDHLSGFFSSAGTAIPSTLACFLALGFPELL
jgi:hypothetical protein